MLCPSKLTGFSYSKYDQPSYYIMPFFLNQNNTRGLICDKYFKYSLSVDVVVVLVSGMYHDN